MRSPTTGPVVIFAERVWAAAPLNRLLRNTWIPPSKVDEHSDAHAPPVTFPTGKQGLSCRPGAHFLRLFLRHVLLYVHHRSLSLLANKF